MRTRFLIVLIFTALGIVGCVESAPTAPSENSATDAGQSQSDAASCLDACQPACGPDNTSAMVCDEVSEGCFEMREVGCAAGTLCEAALGTCTSSCVQCSVGEMECNGDRSQRRTCMEGTNGCTSWNDESCEEGVCLDAPARCVPHECPVGESRCDGLLLQRCSANQNRVREWSAPESCPPNQVCNGGSCQCITDCVPGTIECDGAATRICETDAASGCNVWNAHPCNGVTPGVLVSCGPAQDEAQKCDTTNSVCALPEPVECTSCTVGGGGQILCTDM